jgi:hypothetical protein
MNVYTYKLITGEEIIAKQMSEDSSGYEIAHPINLLPNGNGGAVLAPYLMTGDVTEPIRLHKTAVIIATKSKDDIAVKYTEAISGLLLPKSKIIMG